MDPKLPPVDSETASAIRIKDIYQTLSLNPYLRMNRENDVVSSFAIILQSEDTIEAYQVLPPPCIETVEQPRFQRAASITFTSARDVYAHTHQHGALERSRFLQLIYRDLDSQKDISGMILCFSPGQNEPPKELYAIVSSRPMQHPVEYKGNNIYKVDNEAVFKNLNSPPASCNQFEVMKRSAFEAYTCSIAKDIPRDMTQPFRLYCLEWLHTHSVRLTKAGDLPFPRRYLGASFAWTNIAMMCMERVLQELSRFSHQNHLNPPLEITINPIFIMFPGSDVIYQIIYETQVAWKNRACQFMQYIDPFSVPVDRPSSDMAYIFLSIWALLIAPQNKIHIPVVLEPLSAQEDQLTSLLSQHSSLYAQHEAHGKRLADNYVFQRISAYERELRESGEESLIKRAILPITIRARRFNPLVPYADPFEEIKTISACWVVLPDSHGTFRLLTCAHPLEGAYEISVQHPLSKESITCIVSYLSHDCDLALLSIPSLELFWDVPPLTLLSKTDTSFAHEALDFYGYQGQKTSVLKKSVTYIHHVDMLMSPHSQIELLHYQYNLSLDKESTGGPVFFKSQIVGVCVHTGPESTFTTSTASSTLWKFLEDYMHRQAKRRGFLQIDFTYQTIMNNAMRKFYGLVDCGVRITQKSTTFGLEVGDILLEIGGASILCDGKIVDPSWGPLPLEHKVSTLSLSKSIPMKIKRPVTFSSFSSETLLHPKLCYIAQSIKPPIFFGADRGPIMPNVLREPPQYMVVGGFVITVLTWELAWTLPCAHLKPLLDESFADTIFVIVEILPGKEWEGYTSCLYDTISYVQGHDLSSLADLREYMLSLQPGTYLSLTLGSCQEVIIEYQPEKQKVLLDRYQISPPERIYCLSPKERSMTDSSSTATSPSLTSPCLFSRKKHPSGFVIETSETKADPSAHCSPSGKSLFAIK